MAADNNLVEEGEEEEAVEEMEEMETTSRLPPPPPLQRAPQYRASRTSLQERRGEGQAVMMVSSTPVRLQERVQREEAGEGVSKLVMKSSGGGGRGSTRRRALIHSIPKFSQVRPTHQLAVAQRLLQERLLQKRGGAAELLQGMAALEAQEQQRIASVQKEVKVIEKKEEKQMGNGSRPVRRERKPRKTAICRIQPEEEESKEKQQNVLDNEATARCLPELTITRRPSPSSSSSSSPSSHQHSTSSPLDLSRPRLAPSPPSPHPGPTTSLSPPPSSPHNSSLSLVLQPPDYEALAPHHPLYATYIFLPSIGVFVHPLAIPPELAPPPQEAGVKQHFDPKRRPNTSLNNNINAEFDLKPDVTSVNGSHIASRQEESLCKSKSVEMMLVASQEKKTETGATFCKFKSVKTGSIKNSNIEPQPSS